MKSEITKKVIISILLLIFVFVLDRITKITILNIAEETGKVDIYVNQFLNFYLVWNKGIGFGLLSSDQEYIYSAVTYIIVIINIFDFFRKRLQKILIISHFRRVIRQFI